MRALIVDDSRFIRGYLKSLLNGHGVECEVAENGQAALECLGSSGPYDLTLVDCNMPVMGGLEMVHAVRRNPKFGAVKILMMTTEVEDRLIAAGMNAGADGYVMKPFGGSRLLEKLEGLGVLSC